MSWRQIHESVNASESLASLSADAERLFWRMLAQTDPWGRLRGEAAKVSVTCAALLGWSPEEVETLLGELEQAGRVVRYEVGGKLYAQLLDFDEHQPETARKRGASKYPSPENGSTIRGAEFRSSPEKGAEGRGGADFSGEGRLEGVESRKDLRVAARASTAPSEESGQALVAHLVDEARRLGVTLPARTKGHVAKTAKGLLEDGIEAAVLRGALTAMLERGRPAAALADIARELEARSRRERLAPVPDDETPYNLLPAGERF